MGATYSALLGSLSSSLVGGPLQAATASGLAAKMSAYSFSASISVSFSVGESWPMFASSRLLCWANSRDSACLSGTFSVFLSSSIQVWGRGFNRDWIRGVSKLLTLYTVATGTPLEMEIGLVATFVTLHLSGLPGSHRCILRGIPISTPSLRLNFSRGLVITSNHVCGWGPLTRASTCTLVRPGSDATALLKCNTQSNMPSPSHTAPSTAVGLSVSVWLGVGNSSPGCWFEGGWLAGAGAVSVLAIAASVAACWRRRSSLRRAFRLALTVAAWLRRHSLIVQQIFVPMVDNLIGGWSNSAEGCPRGSDVLR